MRNPLLDKDFLKELDSQKEHEVYAKIIALTFEEDPTEEITGRVTSGSVNIDGTSAIRRSCSVGLVAKDVNISDFYWGLNTKFELQIGLKNTINPSYPNIIWFKQGRFLITSFSTSLSANGYNINISGKDKMCLLNGDIGGIINSLSVDFGTYDEIDADGNTVRYDYPIKEIILEAVHQYAGEPYHNIVIEDLDDQGFELMEYRGDVDLYMLIDAESEEVTNIRFNDETLSPYNIYDNKVYYVKEEDDSIFDSKQEYFSRFLKGESEDGQPIYSYHVEALSFATYESGKYWIKDTSIDRFTDKTINLNSASFKYDSRITALDFVSDQEPTHIWVQTNSGKKIYTVARIQYGQTCGYRLTELTYAGDLIGAAGSTITAILDKIVAMLGNYEYFYDTEGIFHFQRKKTYVNNSWNNIVNNRDEIYVDSAAYTSSSVYSFTDSNLVSAFNNTPDLSNLKNDFAIWGKRTSSSGSSIPIHLRYAVDKKPVYYKNYAGKIYLTQEEYDRLIVSDESSSRFEQTTVTTGDSLFHVTPLPPGISQKWWEIDDWARRYMYFADTNNEHNMDYYLNLTSQELCDIVNASTQPTSEEVIQKTFNYYVFQLKKLQLGNFGQEWKCEDWLISMPLPSGASSSFYSSIQKAAQNNQAYWVYLFDTALYDGKEYIKSIVHGHTTTANKDIYPSDAPGCSHVFSYALEGKKTGEANFYHTYIYNPQIPDSVKADMSFINKVGTDETVTVLQNYEITDWREIIFQMQKDYFKYQHDEDFLAVIAKNNADYYPEGYTGYEQYYTDMNGFWRKLYNPDITPIDLNSFNPEDSNHYYIWNPDTQSFSEYTFRQATQVLPLEDDVDYFYYRGIKTIDTLIAIEKAKQDAIDAASSAMARESKSLDPENFSTKQMYEAALERVINKYTNIIARNQASLNESAGGYTKKQFLEVKTTTIAADGSTTVTYNATLADDLVKAFYPYYDKVSEGNWKDYAPYTHFNNRDSYYKLNFIKDLTQLSSKVGYYTKSFDNAGHAVYTKWTPTVTVEDFEGKPDELGGYPLRDVPSFQVGKKYYTYEGYEKVASLEVGESGNTYYTYSSYKQPTSYVADATYYTRALGSYIDNKYTYIFTPVSDGTVTATNYTNYYINVPNPNAADKTIVKGYSVILQLDPNEKYYSLVEDSAGNVIASTPTYFTRGKNYYTKNKNGLYELAFTFEKGTVYYLYNGYKEALDLTIDNADNEKLSTGSFYFLFGEETKTIINTDDTNVYFTLGKIYYGYTKVDNNKLTNGKYYVSHDNHITFEEENILKTFARGSTYYIYDEDYDLIDPYEGFNSSETYYLYLPDVNLNKGQSKYYSTAEVINIYGQVDENNKLTRVSMNELNEKYGLYVNEDKEVYRLGQAFKFYVKRTRYREVNYYKFAFYKQAEKYYSGVQYYRREGNEYIMANPTNQNDFDRAVYYTLLDGYKRATAYDETAKYFTRQDSTYKEVVGTVTKRDFNTSAYFIEDHFYVYLSDEFNIDTHWSMNMEYPEKLIFWFDFLDITDGALAQYAVHSVGSRPKSVNNDNIKAIYYRDTPTVIFCGTDGVYIKVFINKELFNSQKNMYYEKDTRGNYSLATTYSANKDYYRRMQPEDKQPGYTYINLTDTVDNLFSISSQGKTAFDMLNNYLFNYSYCTESITMTTIPIYYLEPNTRIFVRDDKSGINGEYIVSRLTVPLQYNGTMQITATKAVDRII